MCMNSVPASTQLAKRNDLKLSIGLVTRLMARWSCSTMLLRVFDLAHHDRHVALGVARADGRFVGAALVHRDLPGLAVHLHGLVEEALCRRLRAVMP